MASRPAPLLTAIACVGNVLFALGIGAVALLFVLPWEGGGQAVPVIVSACGGYALVNVGALKSKSKRWRIAWAIPAVGGNLAFLVLAWMSLCGVLNLPAYIAVTLLVPVVLNSVALVAAFGRREYLKYDSIRAWIVGEHIPTPIGWIPDPAVRDRCIRQLGELRRRLFAKHLRTLSREARRQFKQGRHPSQSHAFADRAEPFVRRLRDHLAALGFSASVELGWYHGDRIVLTAELPADPGAAVDRLPWLFEGFEVKYSWPRCPPNED